MVPRFIAGGGSKSCGSSSASSSSPRSNSDGELDARGDAAGRLDDGRDVDRIERVSMFETLSSTVRGKLLQPSALPLRPRTNSPSSVKRTP